MIVIVRKIVRIIDFLFALVLSFFLLIVLLVRRVFGKIRIQDPKDRLLSITKDGIYRILQCNGNDYFEWDFTRPHADKTYVLYIGPEKPHIFKLSKKVVGINRIMPLDSIRSFAPFTITVIQQFVALIVTIRIIKKISPKVIEVMFPSKLALRALLLKWILPIKVVTQVRGNLDLIYYFNPFPTFWFFKISCQPFETFQILWDKLISLLFYRACDLVIGYNINNMLSAISNGAHPKKTRLSRIKIELSMLSESKIPREQLEDIPHQGKIVSIWSRLSPEKLVLESIQAFEKLFKIMNDDLHLIVIGNGPEYQKIISYLATSDVKNNIHLLGYKERSFIAQVARHSSLAVIPYGGSSLVEAVMMEIPVVALDIEWHNELIRDGETGYLADFPDINHLAHQMLQSLSDPKKSMAMAQNAKHLAQKMFDIQKTDEKESKYYKALFE